MPTKLFRVVFGLGLAVFLDVTSAGPKIEYWSTTAGTRVYLYQTEALPILDVQVVFQAGSARDGKQFGLAALTSALLDTGAGPWNADTIAQRLESVGAELGASTSIESSSLSLRCLTEPRILNSALETAATILTKPSFNPADFEREKKRTLVGLRQREESPGAIAKVKYFKALYGDHPYAHPVAGELDTVGTLRREDLVEYYRRYYVASNAIVVVVGDVSKAKTETIVRRLVGGLPAGTVAAPIPSLPKGPGGSIQRVDYPSTQSHIYTGMPVLMRKDADYFPLYVGNHILGGSGLVSRISNEVREKRGLSYSSSSYFSPMSRPGPYFASLQTRNDQADEALGILTQTVKDFINDGPSEAELEAAKKNITGGFVLRIDSNAKLAGYIAMIGFYQLPLYYLDVFPRRVNEVTVAQIVDAFTRRVQPDRFSTVIVGGAD